MNTLYLHDELKRFLLEDLGSVRVDNAMHGIVEARIEAQEDGVASCLWLLAELFSLMTPFTARSRPEVWDHLADGATFKAGATLVQMRVHPETLRHGIRTGLNLLQLTCGVAARTAELKRRIAGTGCQLLDTRKTTPGLRAFEKFAVLCGGGANHRHGRFDGLMLKREDIVIDGGISDAVRRAVKTTAHLTGIEVEIDTLAELQELLDLHEIPELRHRVRHALLDNMSVEEVASAVQMAGDRLMLEASGISMDEGVLERYAATGVPAISTSALILTAKRVKMHLVMSA